MRWLPINLHANLFALAFQLFRTCYICIALRLYWYTGLHSEETLKYSKLRLKELNHDRTRFKYNDKERNRSEYYSNPMNTTVPNRT